MQSWSAEKKQARSLPSKMSSLQGLITDHNRTWLNELCPGSPGWFPAVGSQMNCSSHDVWRNAAVDQNCIYNDFVCLYFVCVSELPLFHKASLLSRNDQMIKNTFMMCLCGHFRIKTTVTKLRLRPDDKTTTSHRHPSGRDPVADT